MKDIFFRKKRGYILEKKLFSWQTAGFIFTSLLGTLLHFVYEWSGKSIIASLFSAVNESTWEHMKILFFPMLIFAVIEKHFIGEDLKSFWNVKLVGISHGLIAIPVLFYTYNGIFGKSPAWINIMIFYISSAIAFLREYKSFKKEKSYYFSQLTAFFALVLIAIAFFVFTFAKPDLPIFK